ncbi:retrovirus-related pol polyprotein from transposon TNT 1-94 [Tanacetum coccineum]
MKILTFHSTSFSLGRSPLNWCPKEKHVPEVITQNEQDIPHTESVEGLPDQENIKGTQEQVVQYEQINHQSTKESRYWSQNQHIKLGRYSLGVLGEEPKKMSEELKHPGWVKAIQEELNQLYRNKVSTLVPLPQGRGIDYDVNNLTPVARMEAIRIFIAFATYMNFIVFQMDVKSAFLNGKLKEEAYVKQPPGFKSTKFPDYVCKLDKALYGRKQSPRACLRKPDDKEFELSTVLAGNTSRMRPLYREWIGSTDVLMQQA